MAIAFFAMLLAITGLGGSECREGDVEQQHPGIQLLEFFQAKNVRQTVYQLTADEFELAWLNDSSLSPEARAALKAKADAYRKTVARYDSEPETNEGKKELIARAKEHEAKRDHRAEAGPLFRLCRSAAADRYRFDFGCDHCRPCLAQLFRRRARRHRRAFDDQRLSAAGGSAVPQLIRDHSHFTERSAPALMESAGALRFFFDAFFTRTGTHFAGKRSKRWPVFGHRRICGMRRVENRGRQHSAPVATCRDNAIKPSS